MGRAIENKVNSILNGSVQEILDELLEQAEK